MLSNPSVSIRSSLSSSNVSSPFFVALADQQRIKHKPSAFGNYLKKERKLKDPGKFKAYSFHSLEWEMLKEMAQIFQVWRS